MAVALFRTLGQMEHSNAGAPLSGGRVYPQRNDTSAPANTYLDSVGSTLNNFEDDADTLGPYIELDSNGRYPESVFLADTASYPAGYKFIVRDANKVVQYTLSDVPAAAVAFTGGSFAAELMTWIQVTTTPLNLTAADAGKCYELDTTSGSITVNLPTAAATGNGKGFSFKKKSANNIATIARAGADTIDGDTSKVLYALNEMVKVSSTGATWNRSGDYTNNLNNINLSNGTDGGKITLALPASGHTLSGRIVIDSTANSFRIFENGGAARGCSMDLTTMAAAASSAIMHSGIAATQAQMETPSSTAIPVTPARMHFHPAVAKAWAYVNFPAGVPTIFASYNVGSVVDGGVGIVSVVFVTSFSSANYAPLVSNFLSATGIAHVADFTASNVVVHSRNTGGTLQDPFGIMLVAFGDFS